MQEVITIQDKLDIEQAVPWTQVERPTTIYQLLSETAERKGDRNAISFQLLSDPQSSAETLTWKEFHAKVTQAANLFRSYGIGNDDVIAYLLPNTTETAITLLGGMVAGKVCPINPLLSAEQIAGILRASNAKMLVTLRSFPKTNIAQLASAAVAQAPGIRRILEVDLARYLSPPKSWIVAMLRPKNQPSRQVPTSNFNAELESQSSNRLNFEDTDPERIVALFHTGGTTGLPKLVQHQQSGIIYNAWCSSTVGLAADDVVFCPLPLFHVFAAYPIMMASMWRGAHTVFPTPAGYRGDKVFDNFWKLIERWKISYLVSVPTALAALMQRPIDGDITSLKTALCGSAPLPVELFNKFEKATGVNVLEGYGLTEATCLVAVNPLGGKKKIGSVGIPFPYTDVRILEADSTGRGATECQTGMVGEICLSSPGVLVGRTYTDESKNQKLYADEQWLRTGDLGKLDEDGYLWITGRAKDLIIRGGHNVDPAIIEEAMAAHPEVAFVGVIGQPDSHLGEVPCAYIEPVRGASTTVEELTAFADQHITDRLATPAYLEIMDELPKTAVGKVFKPDLRKMAINRVISSKFVEEGIPTNTFVIEDPKAGLVLHVGNVADGSQRRKIEEILGHYALVWTWCD